MLEIIAIVLLSQQMGKMAERKGQKKGTWILFTVLGWIIGEVIGILIAISAFNAEDYIAMLPMALLGAVTGYFVVRMILSRMPDKPEEGFEFENKENNPQ
jgi:hypothetical protein